MAPILLNSLPTGMNRRFERRFSIKDAPLKIGKRPMQQIFHIRDSAETPSPSQQDKILQRRRTLFGEPLAQRFQRIALGAAYLLMPKRLAELPAFSWNVVTSLIAGGVAAPSDANVRSAGFAGVIRDANPGSLLAAHRAGFFPQAHMGPLKWWTRDQRYVQILAERRIPKTLRNEMRKSRLVVTFDQAFDAVIKACAEPRPGRPKLTWITPQIMHLYAQLADAGHAHSFEVWDETGELVGGGYGVAIGRVFITESLFSRSSSASKMAMQSLNFHLHRWGYLMNDVKDFAPHFANIGSRHMSRADYSAILGEYGDAPLPVNAGVVPWRVSATLADIIAATKSSPRRPSPKRRRLRERVQRPQASISRDQRRSPNRARY
jgi:leucyl/phenylalanyl-tRNA---protein transferase